MTKASDVAKKKQQFAKKLKLVRNKTQLTLVFILVTVINILFSLYEVGGVLGKDNKS